MLASTCPGSHSAGIKGYGLAKMFDADYSAVRNEGNTIIYSIILYSGFYSKAENFWALHCVGEVRRKTIPLPGILRVPNYTVDGQYLNRGL